MIPAIEPPEGLTAEQLIAFYQLRLEPVARYWSQEDAPLVAELVQLNEQMPTLALDDDELVRVMAQQKTLCDRLLLSPLAKRFAGLGRDPDDWPDEVQRPQSSEEIDAALIESDIRQDPDVVAREAQYDLLIYDPDEGDDELAPPAS